MQKKLSKILSVMLCLAILCNVSAYAIETRASDHIIRSSATLALKSNGDLSLSFNVTANDIMDTLGVSSIEIQRYTGSKWAAEYTCTVEDISALQTSNAVYHSKTLTYTPNYSGYSYRAVVTFYAQDSSGSSTTTVTTNSV